jgi:hypothetical protein
VGGVRRLAHAQQGQHGRSGRLRRVHRCNRPVDMVTAEAICRQYAEVVGRPSSKRGDDSSAARRTCGSCASGTWSGCRGSSARPSWT